MAASDLAGTLSLLCIRLLLARGGGRRRSRTRTDERKQRQAKDAAIVPAAGVEDATAWPGCTVRRRRTKKKCRHGCSCKCAFGCSCCSAARAVLAKGEQRRRASTGAARAQPRAQVIQLYGDSVSEIQCCAVTIAVIRARIR